MSAEKKEELIALLRELGCLVGTRTHEREEIADVIIKFFKSSKKTKSGKAAKSGLTDVGFKRHINQVHKLSDGQERSFAKCTQCGSRVYYDYTPYSLSNPIIITECGHDFKINYKSF